jgi:hypothetical protein
MPLSDSRASGLTVYSAVVTAAHVRRACATSPVIHGRLVNVFPPQEGPRLTIALVADCLKNAAAAGPVLRCDTRGRN